MSWRGIRSQKRHPTAPPRLARWLLRGRLRAEDREFFLGDLEEEFRDDIVPRLGRHAARRWYWRQALGSLVSLKRPQRNGKKNTQSKGDGLMQSFGQDLRFGLRMLAKNPGFTAVAVLTLALGIGANTAIFSLGEAVLWRPHPGVKDPKQLVLIGETYKGTGFRVISNLAFRAFRERNTTLSQLAAQYTVAFGISTGERTERVIAGMVSGSYFQTVGVEAALGRTLTPEDDVAPGQHRVAVIGHGLWRRMLGSDPAVVGKTVKLNGESFVIVGVAPKAFQGISGWRQAEEIWVPIMMLDQLLPQLSGMLERPRATWLVLVGRLKPGVSAEQAQAELATLERQVHRELNVFDAERGMVVIPSANLNPFARSMLEWLFGLAGVAVGVVLLVACSNVANLLLVRGQARERETALRSALGATRGRLTRQLLTENLLLWTLGGLGGLLAAYWAAGLLWQLAPSFLVSAMAVDPRPDRTVLGFGLALSLVTGVLFSLIPLWKAGRPDLVSILKAGGGNRTVGRAGLMKSSVIFQVALCSVLLVGATLLAQTVWRMQSIPLGFNAENVLLVSLDPALMGYEPKETYGFYQRLLERVRAIPGVQSAALASNSHLSGSNLGGGVTVDPLTNGGEQKKIYADQTAITLGYLETLQIPLLRGRALTDADQAGSQPVILINETLARQAFPDQDPIGQVIRLGEAPFEVVGVVKDSRKRSLVEEVTPGIFFPFPQYYRSRMILHVRAHAQPRALEPAVRAAAREIDPSVPLFGVIAMKEQLNRFLGDERSRALFVCSFSLLALVLAVVGLYGVVSYSVSQRTHEVGVRLALGAQRGHILRMVVGQGMTLVLIGLALGLAGSIALTRYLESLLFGVSPTDPMTFAAVSLLLTGVALLACYVPARRATRVDPIVALRYE